jgi:hypothetical protein
MFQSTGRLRYTENPYKLIVDADNQIAMYYRSLVPKSVRVNGTRFRAHISVVRKETPRNLCAWRTHEGKLISFEYDNYVYNDEKYYWLNVFCPQLEDVRRELGLSLCSGITRSPDGRHKFHMTIGNTKDV